MAEKHVTTKGSGERIDPGDGIVPILKEHYRGKLSVIGTGFYITRYGLLMTAHHVLEDLLNDKGQIANQGFVVHLAGETGIHMRRLLVLHCCKMSDLAVAQADNYRERVPQNPLMNLRAKLTTELPTIGEQLVTYAYPENEVIDFRNEKQIPTIRGDYYAGEFSRYVDPPENPLMPCPYLETTIEIKSGASGGPVFDTKGRVVGVNCRGWDFGGAEHDGNNLSYIIPIRHALPITVSHLQLPDPSWEHRQMPTDSKNGALSFAQLAKIGHILLE